MWSPSLPARRGRSIHRTAWLEGYWVHQTQTHCASSQRPVGVLPFQTGRGEHVSCAHRRADFRRVCGCCPLRSPLRHTRVQAGGVVDSVIALGARLPQRLVEKEDGLARRFGQVAGRPAHLPRHLQVVPPNAATRYTGRAALLSYKPPRVITTHFVLAKRIDPFHHSDCRHKHVLS